MTRAVGLFVTGTDTGCGKTIVTLGMMQALARPDRRIGGFKPVAAGAEYAPAGLRNADALAIQRLCQPVPAYELINPICLEPAIAPHIAAAEVGGVIALGPIVAAHDRLARQYDIILVEGAGGWRVPLGDDLDIAGLAARLGYPVVLVVGMRLGSINHALLTCESITRSGQRLVGWVANLTDPSMTRQRENLDTLRAAIAAPCLGVIPNLDRVNAATVAEHLCVKEMEAVFA